MKKNVESMLILFVSAIGLISCAGDTTEVIIPTDPIVSIAGTAGGALQTVKFKLDTLVEVKYQVNCESVNPLTKDLPITIGVTTAALDFLKTTNTKRATTGDDAYEALPTSIYTIVNPVIKVGQKSADFSVKVKLPKTLDFSKEYVIPIGISNASGAKISETLGFVNIFVDGTPNKYEGIYQSTGYFTHPTSPRAINREKPLKTIDKVTSETEFADLGITMWLKVNKDNSVTIIPQATASGLAGPFEQTGINKYDPASKTFTLNYQYTSGTRIISEKITKK